MTTEPDDDPDAATLVRCMHTRRRRKCIAAGEHTDGECLNCGTTTETTTG